MSAECVAFEMKDIKAAWEYMDFENLMQVAELTNTPYSIILGANEGKVSLGNLTFRDRFFQEENMFTRLRLTALSENLSETFHALPYMRNQHMNQFRKKGKYSTELVQYINHPLLMACQAHAYGVRDDVLLTAILLHDVVEDTGVALEDLPFSDEVKEIVGLVTFSMSSDQSKQDAKKQYYHDIRENGKACVVKIIDRCNNLSTMAGSFSTERMLEYIEETEQYILPLTDVLKNEYLEYNDMAFLVKYQILGIIETIKNLIIF